MEQVHSGRITKFLCVCFCSLTSIIPFLSLFFSAGAPERRNASARLSPAVLHPTSSSVCASVSTQTTSQCPSSVSRSVETHYQHMLLTTMSIEARSIFSDPRRHPGGLKRERTMATWHINHHFSSYPVNCFPNKMVPVVIVGTHTYPFFVFCPLTFIFNWRTVMFKGPKCHFDCLKVLICAQGAGIRPDRIISQQDLERHSGLLFFQRCVSLTRICLENKR